MISEEALRMASQCRHYAMCKIDFLGTGICPSGKEKHFVSYFPQGRMDIYSALASGLLPLTEGLIDIADTCTLCGICDKQCHFVTGMRPMSVMKALKEHVDTLIKEGRKIEPVQEDRTVRALQEIVGAQWATNEPAILLTYADDPFPLAQMQMPGAVVLPSVRDEIVEIVNFASKNDIPYVVRGNGGSVFGFVFTDGIVIDTIRMKGIEIDRDNWVAAAMPGVTSFELQKEVFKQGFRVNVAEPAATVCGNIVCTGTFSTWANAYGVGADNFVNAEFIDSKGHVFHLNEKSAPNVFAFENGGAPAPGICTKVFMKMHPLVEDEEGLLVPFADFDKAVALARELAARRIGFAIGVLGGHFLATFISPSLALADKIKENLTETLQIKYVVFLTGDQYARDAVRKMAVPVIDSSLFRMLALSLPMLVKDDWNDILQGLESDRYPYEILCKKELQPLLETILEPSPETIADAVDEDLRAFYRELYSRPEMTDPVWLNMFRIVSSRMARHKHMFAFLLYVPLDRIAVIHRITEGLHEIAEKYGIDNDYGFLTPIDLGKRAVLEYDYYIDHTDSGEADKIKRAMVEIEPLLDGLAATTKGVKWLKYVFSQGCSRKEQYLYI
ncbi:MAG TPA: FAD-binding oxidoreductase [Syntrophorhabdaceae bacterium]|nr:FAD-binding oxidoreductase [Syntrophorhabdaceae bacterium]